MSHRLALFEFGLNSRSGLVRSISRRLARFADGIARNIQSLLLIHYLLHRARRGAIKNGWRGKKGSQPHGICRYLGFALIVGVKLLRSPVLLILELPGILRRVASPKARSGSVIQGLLRFS